jgi:hypothetical protein
VRHAGKLCQSVRGTAIDEAIESLLLETVAPAALESAMAVQDEIANRVEEAESLRLTTLERARYEAELARRRYLKVDPDNRLVADAIEAEWNTRLRELDELQQAHDRHHDADQVLLSDQMRKNIRQLATNFPHVWSDPRTSAQEKKRLVALLIEDVTLTRHDTIAVDIRFRGGRLRSLHVAPPLPMARVRKTKPAVIKALQTLLETCTDSEAALRLNQAGHCNWKGEAFTAKRVGLVRRTYDLRSRFEHLTADSFVTASELGAHLGVAAPTVRSWARRGLLRCERYGDCVRCLYALYPGTTIEPGIGGRYQPKPPSVITLSTTEQETV